MKHINKLLTFTLAVLFVLGMMVSPAFAQSESGADPTIGHQEEATATTEQEENEPESEPFSTAKEQEPTASSTPAESSAPSASPASPSPSPSAPNDAAAGQEEMDMLEIAPLTLAVGPDVTVTTWDDFRDSVEQAEVDGKIIRLDPVLAGTIPASVTMNITHNNSIIIDGGGAAFTSPTGTKAFTFNNTGSGRITLQNMTLDGTGGSGGMLSVTGSSVTLSDMTIQNVSGTAVAISGANATLNNVTVDTATNGITGSGTLDIMDSTFTGIATTAVAAGSGNVSITDTTIDGVTNGAGVRGGAGTLDVTGSTLQNITGNGIVGSSGTVTIDDCTFSDMNGVGISGGSNVVVKNTLFENVRNNLGGHGSAIYSSGNLTVEDSSFVNSASTLDGGYIQGAIVAFGGSGRSINVTRSYFKDNKASRYGGAIGFYQFGGTVNISYSYFEGNGVSGKNANSDGGAIGVFNTNTGAAATVNVDNCTFIGNTAQDDGSAYFAESRNDLTVSNLTHNTFYGNKASKYLLAAADSGGVVQLSLDTVGHFKNNTFIGNTAPNYASLHGAGAAIGQHIDSANAAVRPSATFQNNIFVGNGGNGGNNYASRNVDIPDGTDLGGNVGYDNGTPVDASVTADSVFGTSPQPRANNTQYGAAGKASSGHTGTLSTVTILPNDGVTGFADNTAGAPVYSRDARGFTRDSANSDAGAMEIKFVKFDANGGEWSGLASLTYDGSKYYADDTASTGYFLVTNPGGSVSVLTSDLPTNTGKTFEGWYDAPTGGNKITGSVTATDQTLYAHWADAPTIEYTITYRGNGSDIGTVPPVETYDDGDTATIAGPGTMAKTGATFTGWNTADNGAGTSYTAGQTFPITANLELYAQWENTPVPATEYTILYHGNGSDIGTVPLVETYDDGDTATIAGQGTMAKTGATFTGWNTADNGTGTSYTTGQTFPIVADLELYAQWEDEVDPVSLYTLDFDSQGGSPVSSIHDIPSGTAVSEPEPPARAGHTFQGWHKEAETINPWDFDNDVVIGHTTLYAKWQPVAQTLLTVTFDSQGGSAVAPITDIVSGSRITAPTPPTREGYIFRGWYQESECVNYWFFDLYDVNESRTLYAKWETAPATADTATSTSDTPKTGDVGTDISVWLIIAAAAAALTFVSIKLLRRQDD